MRHVIERVLGFQRVTVTESQRVLVLEKGRFATILDAGEHLLRRNVVIQKHDLNGPRFVSTYDEALLRARPDLVETHLTVVRTDADEVAIVTRDGRAYELVMPDQRAVYWTDAADWAVERLDVSDGHGVAPKLAQRLMRSGLAKHMTSVEVAQGHVGILSIDGVHARVLAAGTYWFWLLGRKHLVKLVDTRWQNLDVSGQEILTKDRVTLRVNLSGDYRVTDPALATSAVKDFAQTLHLALQLAFRKTLGALTLDQMLADKVSVDAEAAKAVRAEMALIGVEVGEIALKDVILPGDMRDILNQVVAVQKEAEANVIRRREETNATRSLLNTAKVMADNPVMLRLKELEALEGIVAKVERLTVHNGMDGLMNDLVRLRD